MTIAYIFPVPLYFEFVDEAVLNQIQAEFESVFQDCQTNNKFRNKSIWDGNPDEKDHLVNDPDFTSNLIDDYNLVTFKQELIKHVDRYLETVNLSGGPIPKYSIVESWMVLNKPGSLGGLHRHLPYDLAGVYYFKTNTRDGDLRLLSTVEAPLANRPFNTMQPSNAVVQPEVGKLLLFPGWLVHGSDRNTTDEDRVSVAWNIKFED
jgi:uncharacterized protein (TIGR02466 family)